MKKTVLVAVATAVLVSACTTTDPYTGQQKVSNTAAGAGIGALAGAGLGLLAGGNDRRNALIGAGVGALAGGAIGATMDQNEAELRRQLQGSGVSVTRSGDQIILNMPSDITFNVDQDAVKPGFYQVLNSVALVLNKFPPHHGRRVRPHRTPPVATNTISTCRSAARWQSPIICPGRASIPAALPSPASARRGRSPPMQRPPAVPRTAASRSSSHRSPEQDKQEDGFAHENGPARGRFCVFENLL